MSRRTHPKTRTGCQQCKRRRVKCDERRPSCFNCTRYNAQCSFSYPDLSACPTCGQSRKHSKLLTNSPRSDAKASQNKISPENHEVTLNLDYGNQHASRNQMDAAYNTTDIAISTSSLPTVDQSFDAALADLRHHDFELMHHYFTAAYLTMGLQDELRIVWKNAIPQQGYDHPFVMHGIMAISALHKAYLLYDKADTYLTLSAYHYTRGQAEFRRNLLAVTEGNCKPVFCFSLILIVYMCAAPVTRSPRHIIEDPIQTTLELFLVCRGLRAVTEPYYDRALKSDLYPLVRTSWLTGDDDPLKIPTPSLQNSPLPTDTFEAVDRLRDYLRNQVDLIHLEEAEEAVDYLRATVVHVAMAGINVELGNVVNWPLNLSDTFMSDIKQFRPHALLILAYFAPILGMADRSFWFLHGWSKYLLADIEQRLNNLPELIRYLEWPKAHVR
ncbi:hypothetical protein BFJ63_vAg3484 [Fusarium oxysporum f. sp. narcissi]|uniref:Uncharacterized protein n=3 Tax=Fusarium oxysporum TaxID=5507 RepID=A0A420RQR5_FUSOX|nr:hypothetical protein BFJ65_g17477 [Fusarium oxysporum f. sp. cepae]RKL19353.1 hypothetical protein BFJ68_g3627 [Fusarium oxysporum]RYC93846.1 hypothetical protein BFJ63_vAg3484 [Fusarium oxysporum f. sp. narcissi]RKK38617.1 hypothetical protein BFJ67_g11818 [Fusarium oxysporum f. sp. cepae]RKK40698.1 hypothetical protein BFJ66_g11376 [Fusarium oxysporum f. sp. cepae]